MKMKRRISRYMALLAVAMLSSLTACSYAMDYVERIITTRASFSIDAEFDPGTQIITITWDESGGSNFAGYEIYLTTRPNDEYSDYQVVAARFTLKPDSYFDADGNLGVEGTPSHPYDATDYINAFGSGRYFVRVGIISWDEDPEDRTPENGYYGPESSDYLDQTDLSEISGSAMVDLYIP